MNISDDTISVDLGHGRTALISTEDADVLQQRWYLGALRYAQMHKGENVAYLHRLFLRGCSGGTTGGRNLRPHQR